MPNIREYNDNSNALRPDDRAALANVYAGRSISSAYDSIGRSIGGTVERLGAQYVQHETRKEIAKGAAALAGLQDDLQTAWKGLADGADLNDDSIVDKYRAETLEPSLQGFSDSFTTEEGKQWAQNQVSSLRQHLYEKTAADQATRSGAALGQNLSVLKTRASNIVASDPTSVVATMGLIDNTINGLIDSTPNLTPAQAAQARSELARDIKVSTAKSAVLGTIEASPEEAKKALARGDYDEYLDASEKRQLDNYADGVIRSNAEQARADKAEGQRIAKENANKVASAVVLGMVDKDTGNLRVNPDFYNQLRMYGAMPGADDSTIRALAGMARTAAEDAAKPIPTATDPNTYASFSARMVLPPSDPRALTQTEVYQARARRMLSDKDFTFFNSATEQLNQDPGRKVAYKAVDDYLQTVKSSITQSNIYSGNINPAQDQRYYQYQWTIHTMMDNLIKAGKSPAEAQAILLDPRSPQYAGNLIPQFAIDTKQGMKLMQEQLKGGATVIPYPGAAPAAPGPSALPSAAGPARKQGETAAQYLARTGGK